MPITLPLPLPRFTTRLFGQDQIIHTTWWACSGAPSRSHSPNMYMCHTYGTYTYGAYTYGAPPILQDQLMRTHFVVLQLVSLEKNRAISRLTGEKQQLEGEVLLAVQRAQVGARP